MEPKNPQNVFENLNLLPFGVSWPQRVPFAKDLRSVGACLWCKWLPASCRDTEIWMKLSSIPHTVGGKIHYRLRRIVLM